MTQSDDSWENDPDLEDERAEQEWRQRRHRKLMNLPYGHPDEQDYDED
jgi:hypothetical protein